MISPLDIAQAAALRQGDHGQTLGISERDQKRINRRQYGERSGHWRAAAGCHESAQARMAARQARTKSNSLPSRYGSGASPLIVIAQRTGRSAACGAATICAFNGKASRQISATVGSVTSATIQGNSSSTQRAQRA
jgi:hypothetical protein